MKKLYTTIAMFLVAITIQAQTFEFSLSFLGVNPATNNYQVALIATPSVSVTNGVTADMGAGFYIPTGTTLGNFEMGNSNLPASEWSSQSLGSNSNGDAYFLSRVESGASSIIFDGAAPFELVLFDIIADPNPTSGSITIVENGDPVFDSLFIQNYINININTSGSGDAFSINNPSANSVDFSVLGFDDFEDLENGISVYPNPTSDSINITSTMQIETIKLFDITGKQVLSTSQTNNIKVNHLPIGLYLLKVYSAVGSLTKKVVIN